MADKKKTSDKQTPSLEEIEDAVVLNNAGNAGSTDATVEQADASSVAPQPPESQEDRPQKDADVEAASPGDAAGKRPDTDGDTPDSAKDDAQPPHSEGEADEPKPAPHDAPAKSTETVIVRKGGFFPMLLGGVAAAAIGFGLAHSGALDSLPLPVSGGVQDRLAALDGQITDQQNALSDVTTRLTALEYAPAPEVPEIADLAPRIEDLTTQVGVLAQRIDALEARPAAAGGSGDPQTQADLEAAQAELDQIRHALEAQRSEIAALSDAAAEEEQAARDTARAVMQRAALTRVQTALDTGTPFADALAELQETGAEVPEALSQPAEEGVATLSALQSAFPDLARDALRAARQQTGATGFGGFLETQLGLRSLQPREGDDPDAILSRAEAAVQSGDLNRALTELEALPDAAATVLSDWRMQAQARLATVAAAQDLSQALNTN